MTKRRTYAHASMQTAADSPPPVAPVRRAAERFCGPILLLSAVSTIGSFDAVAVPYTLPCDRGWRRIVTFAKT